MSQLEDRISAVLSDPGELSRLTEMARQLMGGLSQEGGGQSAANPESAPAPGLSGEALNRLLGSLRGQKQVPLMDAVGPYLDEGRRARLSRALRLAAAAKLAAPVLRDLGGSHGL